MGYELKTEEAEITDAGFFISARNMKTGATASAKNRCGHTNRRMDFALSYEGKRRGVCEVTCGRPETIRRLLELTGLPSLRTLRRRAKRDAEKSAG